MKTVQFYKFQFHLNASMEVIKLKLGIEKTEDVVSSSCRIFYKGQRKVRLQTGSYSVWDRKLSRLLMSCCGHQQPSSPVRVNSQDRVSGRLCCALADMSGLGPSLEECCWTASSRGMILFGIFFKSGFEQAYYNGRET